MRKIKNPKIGEYVLITKYCDKDLGDPWALGFFHHKEEEINGKTYYYVKYENGELSTHQNLKHCWRLTQEEGRQRLEEYKFNSWLSK